MTVKTLTYIHKLLEREEETLRSAKRIAYQNMEDAKAEEADNVAELRGIYEDALAAWRKASDALREFENRDW